MADLPQSAPPCLNPACEQQKIDPTQIKILSQTKH